MEDRHWRVGLFSCKNPSLCCMACHGCTNCLLLTYTTFKLLPHYDACSKACFVYCCPICALTIHRGEIRKYYKIEGSCIVDFCIHYFCCCCALLQEYQQVLISTKKELKQLRKNCQQTAAVYNVQTIPQQPDMKQVYPEQAK